MPRLGAVRASSLLLLAGVLVSVIAGFLHPDSTDANDHVHTFAEYAGSTIWIGVHLGQFVGMTLLVAGLVVLTSVLAGGPIATAWMARLGQAAAIVALALYGVLQAVDGVALKHAVDAWAAAPPSDKGARFAVAEGIRWMEWGARSYQSLVLGLAFLTIAVAMAHLWKSVAVLMGIAGLAYALQGWIIGTTGFSHANSLPTLIGIAAVALMSVWFVVRAHLTRAGHPAPIPEPEGALAE